jgi:hypothetical protein
MKSAEQIDELRKVFDTELSPGPFPYEDVRKLGRHEGLVPALDLYFSDIAGIASYGKRFLRISEERKGEFRTILGRSFFERHPGYLSLRPQINAQYVPTLYSLLEATERARVIALQVLREI